ncbi:MAG: hypothetical protein JXR68_09440 [Bacteroidales bacterium]|nr:hypothetical protein [Bacteroidales bacterium]
MVQVFKNKFQVIKFDELFSIIEFSWLPGVTNKLNDKKYIEELKIGADYIINLKPQNVIVKYENFDYPISPDVQEKVNDLLLPAYFVAKIKKLAFLKPHDIIDVWAVEQIIDERMILHTFDTKLFSDEQKALDWIKE